MGAIGLPLDFLRWETASLLSRLDRVQPMSLSMPAVAAAAVTPRCLRAIDRHLAGERVRLHDRVAAFQRWLHGPVARVVPPRVAQLKFSLLRIQFNATLDQLDIFADALTQRSESGTGLWLGGLDVLAEDAFRARGLSFAVPSAVTYLDRGHGAAIRRARTRLPGGSLNPVAVIRIPRERMVGGGIGASLVHEVGHQVAALLDLVRSLRAELNTMQSATGEQRIAWSFWRRWISEIVADFWAVGRLGVGATLGLIGVVGLPRPFVFRLALDDPHPFPWIRVMLSSAIGAALYPDAQWSRLSRLWQTLYPPAGLSSAKAQVIDALLATMPAFVRLLVNHRPVSLEGRSLAEALPLAAYQPAQLRRRRHAWRWSIPNWCTASPIMALAVLGQARADGVISAAGESRMLEQLLRRWALRGALDEQTACRAPADAA